jgi:transcriptional regulator with XRE-family HTH domain
VQPSNGATFAAFFIEKMVEQKVSSGWEYLAARRGTMEYPNNLRRLRDARRLTQADVAEALGINQAEYSRMEKGRRRVGTHLETLTKILTCENAEILAPDQYAGTTDQSQDMPLYALPEIDGESIRFDLAMTSRLPKPACTVGSRSFAMLCNGNVMAPRVHHGDFVYADPDEPLRDNDLCVLTLMRGNREVAIIRQNCGEDVWLRLDTNSEESFGKELKIVAPIMALRFAR